jgi:hypothetical protein
MEVRAHWMLGAFRAIDKHWGNFENYVEQGLSLSRTDVVRLRQALLSPPVAPAGPHSPSASA